MGELTANLAVSCYSGCVVSIIQYKVMNLLIALQLSTLAINGFFCISNPILISSYSYDI